VTSSLAFPYTITDASGPDDVEAARRLFREYADWLKVDLCFQGFAAELATLPGKYTPPDGRLFLARDGPAAVGCIWLRRVDETTGEAKRLYVRPEARGHGLGGELARRVLAAAREIGYRRLVLDTLQPMAEARRLYGSLGFHEIPGYYANPLSGVIYMELVL
jgi:GNAT superfamily N-acetyltransferase